MSEATSPTGSVTLRGAGRLRHFGVGRTSARTDVILLIQDQHVTIINAATGEILRALTRPPARTTNPPDAHQAQQKNRPNLQDAGPARSDVLRHHTVRSAGFEPATS